MANNYTQFSFVVKTTEEQKDWLTEKHNNCLDRFDTIHSNEEMTAEQILEDNNQPVGELNFESIPGSSSMLIYAEESGDIDYTTKLLQSYLKNFDLPDVISFEWADICDKMRPGEFGGGAAAVSRTSIASFTTGNLRVKLEAAFATDTNVAPRPD